MNVKEKYFKRFCLAGKRLPQDASGVWDDIDIYFGKSTDFRDAVLENMEVYRTGEYRFVLLDIHRQINPVDIRNSLPAGSILRPLIDSEKMVLLERIFKKRGQTEDMVLKKKEYVRTLMTLEIKNDPELLRKYIEIHRPENIWKQVLKNMDTIGILDMEIYLLGYQAFLIMDTHPDFDLDREGERWGHLPREEEWQRFVAKFQKTDPNSQAPEKWKPMKRIVEIP